ncbi:MAG TPA: M48 family metallopeptidase [Accumulibacter sp.]|nr:M48 family metallopeptidase [Accumulibacter sp.]HMW17494.1 M48 family metallopeptidase [Accumulibacter sp.]HMX21817.1 M48 family metallopeptidase [Accumulibacter sp.]HMY07405.1 M48 family metallopeptidase [Accumulibacter sp.]HNC19109.1 M48 family metallopeptidase [Accumulibacter sp.]
MTNSFTLVFVAAVACMVVLRLWLAQRQISHVIRSRQTVPAGFTERIPLSSHQRAADYTLARNRFGRLSVLIDVALLLALTLGGGVQTLHEFWSTKLDGLFYGVALILSVLMISSLVDLPQAVYRQFVIEQQFGFNRMTPRLFVLDLLKQLALGVIIGIPLLLVVLWLMAQMGTWWWIYVWLVWCLFNLSILLIYPTWIAPLFNTFVPLTDTALTARVENLLTRCGFASSGLFVMDGSKRSSHGNAYFTGFGRSKRIVFFDTLLSRLQPAEVEAVLAHELGHFAHRHVTKRIVLVFVCSLALLATLGRLIDAPWFFNGLGVSSQNTALALILFFLALPVFTFLLTPLFSLLSRRDEFQADRYAAAHASAAALIAALVKLYEDNAATLTPDPLHSLFYDSHPPATVRIAHLQTL